MKYTCTECRYTYDETFGDTAEGIEPGKNIYEIENFSCPNCNGGVGGFQEIIEVLLTADNPDYLSMVESEHIPTIHHLEDKPGMIEVLIGNPPHCMFEEHYIGMISLHDEEGDVVEEKILSFDDDPVTIFDISDLDNFTVRAKCNQHGVWSTHILDNQGN